MDVAAHACVLLLFAVLFVAYIFSYFFPILETQPGVPTLTYQNLLFCRVPINPILGSRIGTYKKVGFSRSRYSISL